MQKFKQSNTSMWHGSWRRFLGAYHKSSSKYLMKSRRKYSQVDLVRAQLRREIEKTGTVNLNIFQEIFSLLFSANAKDLKRQFKFKLEEVKHEPDSNIDQDLLDIVIPVAKVNGKSRYHAHRMAPNLIERLKKSGIVDHSSNVKAENKSSESERSMEEDDKSDSPVISEDSRCPISLELMRDPAIVSTN